MISKLKQTSDLYGSVRIEVMIKYFSLRLFKYTDTCVQVPFCCTYVENYVPKTKEHPHVHHFPLDISQMVR